MNITADDHYEMCARADFALEVFGPDADKLALKRRLQASLERLEAEKLVSRNGDQWFFLTNEERDVAREIGHVEVSAAEKARLLGEMVFDEVLPACATATPRATTTSTGCWTAHRTRRHTMS
jgi:hypothetical protein